MAYGYRQVSGRELSDIVRRLSQPTQASRSWTHAYDSQGENLRYLKTLDPRIHPQREVNVDDLEGIVRRLVRPTTASIAAVWNFDDQDANLAHLKRKDANIRLPYRVTSPNSPMAGIPGGLIPSGEPDPALGPIPWAARRRQQELQTRLSVDDFPGGAAGRAPPPPSPPRRAWHRDTSGAAGGGERTARSKSPSPNRRVISPNGYRRPKGAYARSRHARTLSVL